MKNIAKGIFAVLLVTGVAYAETTATTDTKTTTETKTTDTKTTTVTTVSGKVGTVMIDKKSFVVITPDGADVDGTYLWTATTKLMWKDAKSTAAMQSDLKTGAPVSVKYTTNADGSMTATEIWFTDVPATAPAK